MIGYGRAYIFLDFISEIHNISTNIIGSPYFLFHKVSHRKANEMVASIILLICAIGGLIMILGGMLLLWKGVITFREKSDASSSDNPQALIVEFKKLRIGTQYPAIAFFIIGSILMVYSINSSQKMELKIIGTTNINKDSISHFKISSKEWTLEPSSNGDITESITPHLGLLKVRLIASGYEPNPYEATYTTDNISFWGTLELGNIDLQKLIEGPNEQQTSELISPLENDISKDKQFGSFGAPSSEQLSWKEKLPLK